SGPRHDQASQHPPGLLRIEAPSLHLVQHHRLVDLEHTASQRLREDVQLVRPERPADKGQLVAQGTRSDLSRNSHGPTLPPDGSGGEYIMQRALPMILAALAGLASAAPGVAAEPAAPAPPAFREYVRVQERPYLRVGLTVTVVDRQGRPVRGLSRDDFRILEDGVAMDLADFGLEGERRDRPLSVAVLLDLSESMTGQVKRVREAAQALLAGLRPADEIMVARFNDQMTVLQKFTSDLGDPSKTLGRIGSARGGTALFRSIEETLKDLRERPGRKVILVVSDGLDADVARSGSVNQSLYLQDLLRLCFRSQTVVYGIRPGMSATSWLPFEGFVEETGG